MQFPTKSRGDSLSAAHVNALSSVARFVTSRLPGSFSLGRGRVGLPPFVQYELIITQDMGEHQYKARRRYFDYTSSGGEEWKKDDNQNEYEVDAKDIDLQLGVNAKLVAYWDAQRTKFVPCYPSMVKMGKLDSQLNYQGQAVVSVWEWNGTIFADSGEDETAHDWCLGKDQWIASGQRVAIARHKDIWAVVGGSITSPAEEALIAYGTLSAVLDAVDVMVSVGTATDSNGDEVDVGVVANTLGLAGQVGDSVVLVRDSSGWFALNVQHHAKNIAVKEVSTGKAIKYDGALNEVKIKAKILQNVSVMTKGDEEWEDQIQLYKHYKVSEVQIVMAGTDGELQLKRAEQPYFETESPSWETNHTFDRVKVQDGMYLGAGSIYANMTNVFTVLPKIASPDEALITTTACPV